MSSPVLAANIDAIADTSKSEGSRGCSLAAMLLNVQEFLSGSWRRVTMGQAFLLDICICSAKQLTQYKVVGI